MDTSMADSSSHASPKPVPLQLQLQPDTSQQSNTDSEEHYSGTNSGGTGGSGNSSITQLIRRKLNFLDDRVWKRFSARRLELIDLHHLSDRKASEQYDMVVRVADQLRQEYGFPENTLDDFDRLVRAAIQSVRRNRKRSRGKTDSVYSPSGVWEPVYPDFPAVDRSAMSREGSIGANTSHIGATSNNINNINANNSRIGTNPSNIGNIGNITTLPPISVIASPHIPSNAQHTTLPPMNTLIGPNTSFLQALNRLSSLVDRGRKDNMNVPLTTNMATNMAANMHNNTNYNTSYTTGEDPEDNTEYLGTSILSTSIGLCIHRRLMLENHNNTSLSNSHLNSHSNSQNIARKARGIRKTLSTPTVISALAGSLGLATPAQLNASLGSCSLLLGFDTLINALCGVFMELVSLDRTLDYHNYLETSDRLAIFFPRHPTTTTSNKDGYSAAAPASSTISTTYTSITSLTGSTNDTSSTLELPRIRPVILRFMNQKLEFTYQPGESGPPTLAEVLDNAHTAFNIAAQKVLLVRNVNRGGQVLETDSDIADAFRGARVDLELTYPTQMR